MMNQRIIVIEGLDGVGKSTIAKLLTHKLIKHGKTVKLIHFEKEYLIKHKITLSSHVDYSVRCHFLLKAFSYIIKKIKEADHDIFIFDRYAYSINGYCKYFCEEFSGDNINYIKPHVKVFLKCADHIRMERIIDRGDASVRKLSINGEIATRIENNILNFHQSKWLEIDTNENNINTCVNKIYNKYKEINK